MGQAAREREAKLVYALEFVLFVMFLMYLTFQVPRQRIGANEVEEEEERGTAEGEDSNRQLCL